MRKVRLLILSITILMLLVQPVCAETFSAPEVPESGQPYMPDNTESFGEGLWYVFKSAISVIRPSITKAAALCVSIIAIVLLTSLLHSMSERSQQTVRITAAIGIGVLLLRSTNTMINLGTDTVGALSEYGKLLIPVMSATMAAQGGVNTSTALYAGTTLFVTVLTNLIVKLIVPLVYIFLCLCISNSAVDEDMLKKLQDLVKWLITWILKTVLYIFTGYISITGVVGGSADASMIKAAKLTISGSVPVVGSILSDASESILVSAGIMKSAAGVYGVLAVAATFIGPFLEIGVQYVLMKLTAALCSVFGQKSIADLLQEFTTAMGFVLAMISSISILLLIGIVCFMKGVL